VPSCIYRINNLQGDLIMLGLIKKLFGAKPAEATQPEAAPYKVETPAAAPVAAPDPAPTPVAEKATEAVVQSIAKPAKKAPVKKAAPKKEAAPKKSGRKPKAK